MKVGEVSDSDADFKVATHQFAEWEKLGMDVGILDPVVTAYAAIVEFNHPFIRDTTDSEEADIRRELKQLIEAGRAPAAALAQVGAKLRDAIQADIVERDLIHTGRMRDSVTFVVQRVDDAGRSG